MGDIVGKGLFSGASEFASPKPTTESPDSGPTSLVHITDAHVAPYGRQTAALKHRSVAVLEDLVAQIEGMDVASTLFGGDNIDNRGRGEDDLKAFLRIVEPLQDRWLAQFGNHEAATERSGRMGKYSFAAAIAGRGVGPGEHDFSRAVGQVRVIGIDTTLIGSPSGFVSPESLRFLVRELESCPEPHVVVLGHHPLAQSWAPHTLESWDREYLVANRDAVSSVLARFHKVRAYLCGHHHSSRIQRVGGASEGAGFFQIQTASPIAFPHSSRILRVYPDRIEVEPLEPRIEGLREEGAEWVLTGRKCQRFEKLGMKMSFLRYLSGGRDDNRVTLHFSARTPAALRLHRR